MPTWNVKALGVALGCTAWRFFLMFRQSMFHDLVNIEGARY